MDKDLSWYLVGIYRLLKINQILKASWLKHRYSYSLYYLVGHLAIMVNSVSHRHNKQSPQNAPALSQLLLHATRKL